ncbi:MAG: hypothetical protein BAJALOKI1v1_590012 [Promethearchaeota archaeon]|nr:MAG: hypothetical protein BAJALOKI1v1_590012 [Candidatus Lokiarchaeota archaeon]
MKNVTEDKEFVSTRHRDAEPDTFDPSVPRLGRRESEPHSAEITYLHDVLIANFPEDRTIWDLHHYFNVAELEIDIQFDISYFRGLKIPYTLASYHANKFDNKVPTMAINILSKSTWRSDFAEKPEYCRLLEIPLYISFPPYHVTKNIFKPPFIRAYILQNNGTYQIHELREITITESGEWNHNAIIDVSEIVPFRIGLRKREQKHQGDESLYRLILIDPENEVILLTEKEQKEQELTQKEQELTQKEQELAQKEQELTQKEQELAQKDQRIKDLKTEILKMKEELNTKN